MPRKPIVDDCHTLLGALHSCHEMWIRDLIVKFANSQLLTSIELQEPCLKEISNVLEHIYVVVSKTYIL